MAGRRQAHAMWSSRVRHRALRAKGMFGADLHILPPNRRLVFCILKPNIVLLYLIYIRQVEFYTVV